MRFDLSMPYFKSSIHILPKSAAERVLWYSAPHRDWDFANGSKPLEVSSKFQDHCNDTVSGFKSSASLALPIMHSSTQMANVQTQKHNATSPEAAFMAHPCLL